MTAPEIIRQLNLNPHPEGGFYKEVYRAKGTIKEQALPSSFGGERNYSTSIYYLLQKGDYSAFHRIKSDELWHFYAGGTLLIHCLSKESGYTCLQLGNNFAKGESFQFVVPAGAWFAAEPAVDTPFTLAGCTVSPGFDFSDFEMANKESLLQQFPHHKAIINRLCR
ncbi:cupin domain-containing protein [Flavisolibacter ginsenosidimutans]|uniref:Cupin domain-containing protein n=1 Tax=Flavisolibacter ginsenosidimutans TaxID=661481 RepID=A0A5B8UKM6_9BACT|nr:cupin domain-containing protein [Flavisolibacter ginsenosidimutans]QEC56565.1 cupin domain-containing protein [Flavisolibacter ginsenosidimutans]